MVNNNAGLPYKINVNKTGALRKDIAFGIIADTHIDGAYGTYPFNSTDKIKRNRITVDDMNTDYPMYNCLGIIHIGDMVDDHKAIQNLVAFRQMWENDYPGYDGGSIAGKSDESYTCYSYGHKIKYPVFPIIGNHDEDDGLIDHNSFYIYNRIVGAPGILSHYSHSAYCWRWGQYFFVQLGLWAGSHLDGYYTDDEKIKWLEDVLYQYVGTSNMGVLVFQHYGWDSFSTTWWTNEQRDLEFDVFCRRNEYQGPDHLNNVPYNVLGFFTGHTHQRMYLPISAGLDKNGDKIIFHNYIMPDVGCDNNHCRGHAIVRLYEDNMVVKVKDRYNNIWYYYRDNNISTGPASPNPFWYVTGNKIQTNGHTNDWGPVRNTYDGKPYGGGEPQGGGAEIFDIDNNNEPDLVLMGVDDLWGRNQFYYSIYMDINDNQVLDTNTVRVYVPTTDLDIGNATAGGGIAIADINNNGTPDIVLMSIANNPNIMNNFRYVIGNDINVFTGKPESWGELVSVSYSNDIGHETAGGGVALYDIDSNGQLDIVLMAIANNSGPNNARYMIGWNIDPSNNGNPTIGPAGTPWKSVVQGPVHLGYESAGGGLAIADIDNNGRPEFVILDIDNPSGSNGFRYDIVWNVDENGNPGSEGWEITSINKYAGYDTDGGGCAVYDLDNDGILDYFFTALDDPFTYHN